MSSSEHNKTIPHELPQQAYELTIITELGEEITVQVDPEKIPFHDDGLPGSILDICIGHGIDLAHSCGGVCACSTCHVYVEVGADTINEITEREEDMLDVAPELKPSSRLGCRVVPNGSKPVRVRIPEWNRNQVKEAPH